MKATTKAEPLFRREWTAVALRERFAPRFSHPNKVAIMEARCPDGAQREGIVAASRWPTQMPAGDVGPERSRLAIETRPGGYGYVASPSGGTDWWMNFAADDLFAYYAGRCFAQDEIQVLEHPVLGSVREALMDDGLSTMVTDEARPTPFLVTGAERRIRFHTEPRPQLGQTEWMYGRTFNQASEDDAVARAEGLEPPTRSNILVIEAPAYGDGEYQPEEVEVALLAAYSGFFAARLETNAMSPGSACVVHTGFWGCGAYGGNHAMMTAIQLLAARLAQIDRLCYHLWDKVGKKRFVAGQELVELVEGEAPGLELNKVIGALVASRLQWGASDGN